MPAEVSWIANCGNYNGR